MKIQKLTKVILFAVIILNAGLLAQNKKLYILHTNNTNGALENCYCPDHPFGAVEKRSIYVSNFIKKHPNSILVDAGDIFTMTHRSYKDSLMAEAYKFLPYDAILLGDQELTMDPGALDDLTKQMDVSVVSTNLKRKGVIPSKILKRGGVKIAILGVMDEYAIKYYSKEIQEKIELSEPIESIKKEMDRLSNRADIFVLLSHHGLDIDKSIAEKIDGLDIIVGSHSQSVIEEPTEVNGTLIVQAGKAGYYIGIVTISMKDGKIVEKTGKIDTMKFKMPDDPRVMELIEEYEKTTGRINRNKQKMLKAKD